MLALGVKMLFNRNAEFTVHSCSLEDGDLDENGACANCHLKDLEDCPEKIITKVKKQETAKK